MLSSQQFDRIARLVPALRPGGAQMGREFRETATFLRIPAGRDVFVEGDPVEAIALLLSGVVRVYKVSDTGREITLYRFGSGQSCILTANAILSRTSFDAIATVEQDAEAVMVPAEAFRDWVRRHDAWRDFVFEMLSQRLASVLAIVEEVAFRRMDRRLASFLAERSGRQNPIRLTHQQIAVELGSAREVVSRILEDFAERGLVRVGRGSVEVVDRAGLVGSDVT
jgi:CRP/FNR family transcriptional regulator